jgi:uncharacterized protein (DUF924 family)
MGANAMNEEWIDAVLHFWFEELEPRYWFTRDERIDALIRERYASLYERVRAMDADEHASPRASLAAVIALDQFPRNMFRNSPRAYESDAQALAISRAAIARGFDVQLDPQQRVFLYMPWQHSEDAAVQARSVDLFARLGEREPLDYAEQHQRIIDRFGRFPHRNAVLQRVSTEEEREFLKTHPGF